jgi:ribosomal-protein-serine acetyltransferase
MFVRDLGGGEHLRLIETRDAEQLFRLVRENESRLRQWVPWLKNTSTIESTRNFIRARLERYADGNGWAAGIWRDDRLVGEIGFDYIDWNNRVTEIGYWIGVEFEGRGLVSKVVRILVDHAVTELGLHRVQIRCAVENHRSRSIPERLGFQLEGKLRGVERLHDRVVDLAVYGMLASEWSSLKNDARISTSRS